MGHLGLTPQSINIMGGFKVHGGKADEALRLPDDAHPLEEAGCFALVLEGIPAELAARTTDDTDHWDWNGSQLLRPVLVFHDILGLTEGHRPKFVRAYAEGFSSCKRCYRVGLPMAAAAHSQHHKNAIRCQKVLGTSSKAGACQPEPRRALQRLARSINASALFRPRRARHAEVIGCIAISSRRPDKSARLPVAANVRQFRCQTTICYDPVLPMIGAAGRGLR